MGIVRNYGRFDLVCDVCGDMADKDFDSFDEAVDGKKRYGWKSQKTNGIWEDVCPACQVLVKAKG